jgi:hypothetical protein
MLRERRSGVEPASLPGCHTDPFTVREIGLSAGAVGASETVARVYADFFWAGRQGGGLLTESISSSILVPIGGGTSTELPQSSLVLP